MKKNKKIVFDDTDIRHAKLKIRLQHDNLTQAEFFRAMVTGYIEKDSSVVRYIHEYKQENKKQSKKALKMVEDDIKNGETLMGKYGIGEEEMEDIFDLIENNHPDL